MFRSTLIAAGAVMLCSTGFAQQQVGSTQLRPINVPIKDGGVYNWSTKQWVSGPNAGFKATNYTIFRNDCTFLGGAFFTQTEHCEDIINDGRIPAPDTKGAPIGATVDNVVTNFQFAYCTQYATGGVDIKIGFYENLGGECGGRAPVRPPSLDSQAAPFQTAIAPLGTATAFFDFGAASGFPLPGTTVDGGFACWTIGFTFAANSGFCMAAEADGTWDNDLNTDPFNWSFRQNNSNQAFPNGSGPILSGEPNTLLPGGGISGFGAGSYNLPPGSDTVSAGYFALCGTGFGTDTDNFWINTDGSAPGIQNTVGTVGTGQCIAGASTGCYFFGGWPAAPLSSFWMVMGSNGDCSGCSNRAVTYCTSGTSANGCVGQINALGSSSATAATGFFLTADEVQGSLAGTNGLFFFASNGRQANGWGNGTSFQCVTPPVFRSQSVIGGGSNGNCDATFSVDLNARWTAKPAAAQGAGTTVQAQLWYRDPFNTSNQTTSLTNAVEWVVCP